MKWRKRVIKMPRHGIRMTPEEFAERTKKMFLKYLLEEMGWSPSQECHPLDLFYQYENFVEAFGVVLEEVLAWQTSTS